MVNTNEILQSTFDGQPMKINITDPGWNYNHPTDIGKIIHYAPRVGKWAVVGREGVDKGQLNHPFVKYIQEALELVDSDQIEVITPDEIEKHNGQEGSFWAPYFDSTVVDHASKIGVHVGDVDGVLNNKGEFQRMVRQNFPGGRNDTGADFIPVGISVGDLLDKIERKLEIDGITVIRVADSRLPGAEGAGRGVMKVTNLKDVEGDVARKLKGFIDTNATTKSEILLERYISHKSSPSVTYFIDNYGNVGHLNVNKQILDGQRFVASTTLNPKGREKFYGKLLNTGYVLATTCSGMGARGCMGFDGLEPEGEENKKEHQEPVYIECNYRDGGATIPHIFASRATNFDADEQELDWMFVLDAVSFREDLNVDDLINQLDETGILFRGRTDDTGNIRCAPLYALNDQPGENCDLVFFATSGRGSLSTQDSLEKINSILDKVGSNVVIPNQMP